MPYSVDGKHSPREFYCPGETNNPNATFQGEDDVEQNSNKNGQEKVFSGLFYTVRKNCDSTKPYNKSLINLVCSVQTPYRPRTRLIKSLIFAGAIIQWSYKYRHLSFC